MAKKARCDRTLFWTSLFNTNEITWQKNIRELAVKAGIDHALYRTLKQAQTFEARWRLVASYSLHHLEERNIINSHYSLPVKGKAQAPVDHLVEKWIHGESGYRTMERPNEYIGEELHNFFNKHYSQKTLVDFFNIPSAPEWVKYAERIQSQFKFAFTARKELT